MTSVVGRKRFLAIERLRMPNVPVAICGMRELLEQDFLVEIPVLMEGRELRFGEQWSRRQVAL